MMLARKTVRSLGAAVALSLVVSSGTVMALDAHDDGEAIPADVSVVEFTVADSTVSVTIPCAVTMPGPPGGDDFQSTVCIDGDQMFVFAGSEGVATGNVGPMVSDFDAAYEEIETSPDTASLVSAEVDGRRTLRAARGPDPAYGVMQAVELADDAVVYVIAMSRPGAEEPLDESAKQRMSDFVNSLEIEE
ncbi:MAG: hypothetical protein ABJN35_03645 [Erythrobacter sp.]